MMNLLVVSDGDSKYGSANSLYGMIKCLSAIDSNIKICMVLRKKSQMSRMYQDLGCKVVEVPYGPYCRTLSYVKWKRPISLMTHYPAYVFGRLFGLNVLEKQVNLNAIDIIHSNTFREDLTWSIRKKYDIPIVRHIREFGDLDYQSFSYRNNYIKKMNESTDVFIAISDIIRAHWINKGIEAEKIIRIYNGVDKSYAPKIQYPQKAELVKFVIVGALLETKRQHVAIEALSRLSPDLRDEAHLYIIGDGNSTYANELTKCVRTFGLNNNVSFLGYLNNPVSQLGNYDCGLMCSKSEGFGRVTAEYMMSGLCVIASDSGANRELIEDGSSGILFNEGDSQDLARKMASVIENRSIIAEYGLKARKRAEDLFTTKKNATEVYRLYKYLYSM